MTPCEKLGYKVGDRFECIEGNASTKRSIGDILVLVRDDGSSAPLFENETTGNKIQHTYLDSVRKINEKLKTGDEITQDGKKYRVTLEEIPQYDFKPGMICRVVWSKADAACSMHSHCTRVVYMRKWRAGREEISYATTDGELDIGYVNTSSLRPE